MQAAPSENRKWPALWAGLYALVLLVLLAAGCDGGGRHHLGDGHDFGHNNSNLYVAMGDSITEGDRANPSYTIELSALLGKPVINEGLSGANSWDGRDLVGPVLEDLKPGYLLILFGVNDLIFNYSPTNIITNLRYMIVAATTNKTIPVIATLTPVFNSYSRLSNDVVQLNINIRQLAKDTGTPLVDLEQAFAWNRQYLQDDGLHPNSQGSELMALTFFDVVW